MNVFYAALLGLLQGLTEFLPVSSSGHLVLAQKLLNVDLGGADLLFDIILHVGTLFSVCVVMHRQLFALFKRPFKKLFYLIAASVPAAAAGVFLGGALYHVPVLIDGFISSVSALAAVRLCPDALGYMLASHASNEPAGKMVLEALGLEPFLYARMCLGEGTGAVAVMPLLDMALAMYRDMSSFSDINIDAYEHLT